MTEEIILSTAAYHGQLCGAISDLDYVQEAQSQQEACIADVDNRYQECEKKLQVLSEETKKARKIHEGWRDSSTIRLAHKLAGKKDKYAAKGSKEEREYVEALQREVREKETFDVLRQLRTEAKIVYDNLSKKAQERQSLKAELGAFYSQVFDGPTSAFVEDDELKEEVEVARWRQDQIQARISGDSEALDLLNRADTHMNACRHKLSEAAGYPRWDIWGGPMGMNDYAICNALERAQALANQAQMLVRQAQTNSPFIGDIGRVEITSRVTIPNNPYCATFAGDPFNNQIRSCAADLVKAHLNLKLQREAVANRLAYARAQVQEATEILNQKEKELESLRGRIFARVVASRRNIPTESPPPYEDQPPDSQGEYTEVSTFQGDSEPSSELADVVQQSLLYETAPMWDTVSTNTNVTV